MDSHRSTVMPWVIALGIASIALIYKSYNPADGSRACGELAQAMTRMELVFGMSRKGAAEVTEAEWQAFLEAEVTPRFPDGLTVLTGYGQWRNAEGRIGKETSRTLIVWHRSTPATVASVEAIRKAWTQRYQQESVMHTTANGCVSFK